MSNFNTNRYNSMGSHVTVCPGANGSFRPCCIDKDGFPVRYCPYGIVGGGATTAVPTETV
ncbi:hypothetical protein HDU76_012197, partial [Blyttiomyces sp. JEL0837]